MKKTNNIKGFTLIEMMVAVAVLGILSIMVYQATEFIYSTYERTEMQYIIQEEVKEAANWVLSNAPTATEAEIITGVPSDHPDRFETTGSNIDENSYLYIAEDTATSKFFIYKRDPGQRSAQIISEYPLDITFDINADSSKMLDYSISADREGILTEDEDDAYTMSGTIYLKNMDSAENIKRSSSATPVGVKLLTIGGVTSGIGATPPSFCFVATASYGDYDKTPVVVLRQFRDSVLMQSELGRSFVDFYYEVSPPIADFIASSEILKAISRVILSPFVFISMIIMEPVLIVIPIVFITIGVVIFRTYRRRRTAKSV